jgi:hypothetical protein
MSEELKPRACLWRWAHSDNPQHGWVASQTIPEPRPAGDGCVALEVIPLFERPTRPAPKADGLVEELERLLESASDGPWAYRPDEYDDWGVIRGAAKTVDWADYPVRPHIARARHSDIQDEEYLAECRRNKIDPWAGDAKLIVWLRNHADTILAALKDRDVVLEEAAKVAESCQEANRPVTNEVANRIANRIRNLKERV